MMRTPNRGIGEGDLPLHYRLAPSSRSAERIGTTLSVSKGWQGGRQPLQSHFASQARAKTLLRCRTPPAPPETQYTAHYDITQYSTVTSGNTDASCGNFGAFSLKRKLPEGLSTLPRHQHLHCVRVRKKYKTFFPKTQFLEIQRTQPLLAKPLPPGIFNATLTSRARGPGPGTLACLGLACWMLRALGRRRWGGLINKSRAFFNLADPLRGPRGLRQSSQGRVDVGRLFVKLRAE
ncbi:hypothetical protein QBC43DRAFT_356686 [Cladorrhinum sp. PSN259]|nr:hypothetical protein QBC43DRAFT_356686 [Cladorrhinum sp. PSN259]